MSIGAPCGAFKKLRAGCHYIFEQIRVAILVTLFSKGKIRFRNELHPFEGMSNLWRSMDNKAIYIWFGYFVCWV